MNKNSALIVAGLIFFIVAVAHFVRIVFNIQILVAGQILPLWCSYLGFVVALALSIWMFVSCKMK